MVNLKKAFFLLDDVDKQMQNRITIDGNIDHPLYVFDIYG
jgi:hypothetical protein